MRCRCSGIADPYSKGAVCSEISQDPSVQAGVGKRGNIGPIGGKNCKVRRGNKNWR